MFCVNCGSTIKEQEGELICKGCSTLNANLREELLALSEKSNNETADLKCPKCGGAHSEEHHFCNSCGAPLAQ